MIQFKWSKPLRPIGPKNTAIICFRCGKKGHPKRLCRTPEHLVKMYQKHQTVDQ
jgi:hypothetical protein